MAQKRSSSRSKRAPKKLASKPVVAQQPVSVPSVPVTKKLPNVLRLSRTSLTTVWRNRKLFAGVLVIYALLSIIFVGGIGSRSSINTDDVGNRALAAVADYSQLLANSINSSDPAAGVYQLFLTLFVSLALIWSLRQVYAGNKVRIRDAYYKGMAPLFPYMLLLLYVCLQLLPFVFAASLYQFIVVSGIATSGLEAGAWLVVALIGGLISAYLITSTVIALFIVTLPDMTPIRALQLAKKLVTGRRFTVLRKLAFLPLILLLVASIILLPVLLLSALAAQIILLLLGPLLIAVGHSYVYALYRELMDD